MKRLSMNLRETDTQRIEALQGKTDMDDQTSVVRRALELYERIVDATRAGKDVLITEDDGVPTKLVLIEVQEVEPAPEPF